MSVHQIIYTSCMRGINGVNDGQQIFSYDAQFKGSNNDNIKSLFSYQPPTLEPGVIMTEEIAATLPRSFIFRKLEDGTCALTLNTYLGRDYMGSAGRFGNYLSHVIVAEQKDFVNYPCEYYGGSLLRDHMEFEEVNNPDPPAYLPTPVLEKGYMVDVDAILEFLSVGDRLEIYKNMLYAMLAFERERKRVLICDAQENILMWIAALEYAVPLKAALGINFTTYEFDPALSASQICGVADKGTRYTSESKRLHFVFDMYQDDCAEFEKDNEYYDFIDTAFSLSFESIQDFHSFMSEGYSYERADEEMYSAYALYSLLSDGINGISRSRLTIALAFAEKYAFDIEKNRITENLLSQYKELLDIGKSLFLDILKYVLSMRKTIDISVYAEAKDTIVDRVLKEFLNPEISEDDFIVFYNDIDKMCEQCELGLATELMKENNREKLFAVMQNDVRTWKIAFIIRVISTYVKENHIPVEELMPDRTLGHTYYGIIKAVYSVNPRNGFFLVTCILNEFSDESSYLVNMSLNIERMLLDIPNGEREVAALWEYFGQKMISSQRDYFDIAYDIFLKYERNEQIFMLFSLEIQEAKDVATSKGIFNRHFNNIVRKYRGYASMYGQNILSLYFNKLKDFDTVPTRDAKLELFDLLVDEKINTYFSDEIVSDLLKNVPLQKPSKQNERFIENAFQYTYNFRRQSVTGKLLLLSIGMIMESISSHMQIKEKINQLEILIQDGRADLSWFPKKSIDDYFNWILPIACKFCQRNDEMAMFFYLFDMSGDIEGQFFSVCTRSYLRRCKEEKSYGIFAEYFEFVCEHSDTHTREEIGKALCRLNKNRMAELDETIREAYRTDRQLMKYWEEIKDTAESTNPLLSNISNLFRRKKEK